MGEKLETVAHVCFLFRSIVRSWVRSLRSPGPWIADERLLRSWRQVHSQVMLMIFLMEQGAFLDDPAMQSEGRSEMDETAVDRVRRRRKELSDEISKLQQEQDRLDAYLQVHEEFSRPDPRKVSGKEIDALCQIVLRDAPEPMTPAQLVAALRKRFGAEITGASPARLVSTRMSALASVESTEHGWRLVSSGIGLELEAYE